MERVSVESVESVVLKIALRALAKRRRLN